jgi:hypothetical protein
MMEVSSLTRDMYMVPRELYPRFSSATGTTETTREFPLCASQTPLCRTEVSRITDGRAVRGDYE